MKYICGKKIKMTNHAPLSNFASPAQLVPLSRTRLPITPKYHHQTRLASLLACRQSVSLPDPHSIGQWHERKDALFYEGKKPLAFHFRGPSS